MRLVMYYSANGAILPVVINKSTLLYRMDILKPDSKTLTQLQSGKSYTGEDVTTSIIYDGFAVTRFVGGPLTIPYKFIKELPPDVLKGIVYDLVFQEDYIFENGNKLGIFGTNKSSGTSSKLSGIKYDKKLMRMIEGNSSFYSEKEIKTLEYFKQTKTIDFDCKDYKCLYTKEAVIEYVNSRNWEEEISAVDTETLGLTFFYNHDNNDELVGISHSYTENQGVFIQFKYKGEQLLNYSEILEILKPLLVAKNIYQNGSFDYRVLRRYGIKVPVYLELTNVLQYTNPDPHKPKALKEVARIILKEDTIELDEILGDNFDARMVEWIDRDLITFYACGDTDKTRTIAFLLLDKMPTHIIKALYSDMYNYNLICIADWYGFPADINILKQIYQGVLQDKVSMEDYILDYISMVAPAMQARKVLTKMGIAKEKITEELIVKVMATEEFNRILRRNMRGTRQLKFELEYAADKKHILYELLDYPQLRYTKTGGLSTGKDYFQDLCKYERDTSSNIAKRDLSTALSDVDEDGQPVKLLSKDKINKFVFPLGYMFLEYAIVCNKEKIYKRLIGNYCNGRTFEPYRYASTATGRLSSAIHTIAGYAKKAIGSTDEAEYGLMVFDADQIEARGVHNEAIRLWDYMMEQPEIKNDKDNPLNKYSYQSVVDIFNNVESDTHTEMAAQFNHVTPREVTSKMRGRGKTVMFSGTYGAHSATMARGELTTARSQAEKQAILKSFAAAKQSWEYTNLHLLNYFELTKTEALFEIPVEEIPFNITDTRVGMTMTRSGRRRYYQLSEVDSKMLGRIQNQGRNQYIQSYCRDIIFIAISNLAKALIAAGFADEDTRGLLFVHDEEGLEYNKTKINPLWLLAMAYKYCCIEIEGHKIKYYVTPAIVSNWKEGKSAYYEVPKKMLAKLSTNISDYEIIEPSKHKSYVIQKIEEYYQDEMLELFKGCIAVGIIDCSKIDVETRYNFFKRAGLHTKNLRKMVPVPELNIIFNHVANNLKAKDYEDIDIVFGEEKYHLKDFIKDEGADTFSVDEFDLHGFETFDDLEELEEAKSLLDYDEVVTSIVNYKTLAELDAEYVSTSREFESTAMNNIFVEKYFKRASINLNKTAKGALSKKAIQEINRILREANTDDGIAINYSTDRQQVAANITVPAKFNFNKFDNFIDSLRKES